MTIRITRLPTGLTIVSDPMPHLMSTALGVWVSCGSRHETPAESGLSHMLEHMAFKGTKRRSARDISTEIEAVGGDLNAYTSREQTAFHARVLKENTDLALDIIADILINPLFDETELANRTRRDHSGDRPDARHAGRSGFRLPAGSMLSGSADRPADIRQ